MRFLTTLYFRDVKEGDAVLLRTGSIAQLPPLGPDTGRFPVFGARRSKPASSHKAPSSPQFLPGGSAAHQQAYQQVESEWTSLTQGAWPSGNKPLHERALSAMKTLAERIHQRWHPYIQVRVMDRFVSHEEERGYDGGVARHWFLKRPVAIDLLEKPQSKKQDMFLVFVHELVHALQYQDSRIELDIPLWRFLSRKKVNKAYEWLYLGVTLNAGSGKKVDLKAAVKQVTETLSKYQRRFVALHLYGEHQAYRLEARMARKMGCINTKNLAQLDKVAQLFLDVARQIHPA